MIRGDLSNLRRGTGVSHNRGNLRRESGTSHNRGGPFRGSWRGGRGNWRNTRDQVPAQVDDKVPLGPVVAEFLLEDITSSATSAEEARITKCEYAASYSLTDEKPYKVVIPGQPATWKPPPVPCQLPGDHGDYLRDHNGARFPDHPLQPAVQALFALDEDFNPSNVDIMGCASSLGDVLRFVRSVDSTFRFNVEMIGDTLFFIRNCRNDVIPDVRGYGHSFLDAFTSAAPGPRAIKSHQRVISYDFAALKCLVRFECDSYLASIEGHDTVVSQPRYNPLPLPGDSIATQKTGMIVPQASLAEIKTKSRAVGEINTSEHLPRLWIRQIPHLIAAYHDRGTFQDVRVGDFRKDLTAWETQHQNELRSFATLLRQLITEVKRASHLKVEVYRAGVGPLQLRERKGDSGQALPSSWEKRWAPRLEPSLEQLVEPEEDSDNESDTYPLTRVSSEGSDGSAADLSFDYTACSTTCGYCGRCA